jgi:cell division transport system permease protein
MKPAATLDQARQAAERVRKRRDVEDVKLVEADDALEEFRRSSGFGEALDALKDNPLPHALVVRPAAEFREASQVEGLTAELRKIDHVDLVQLDTAWVSRFNAILDVVRRVVLLAAGLFALGILVIVGNTIRLDIENRRDEIEVTKLVGGSDAFVRRPFLYSGVWYGLGGAVIAWLIVSIVISVLGDPVQRIAGLYGSTFELNGLRLEGTGVLLLGGVVLGWLGSFIAATRELRGIEPK